jgi:hypothetical protein
LKKLIAIFLFFVFILCTGGFYIAWFASLQAVHNSQKSLIAHSIYSQDKMIKFTMAKNDFETNDEFHFEDENEFEFKNQMYDVISKRIINDSIYLFCISDSEEDNLKNIAISYILQTGNNNTGRELPILKFRIDHYTNDIKNAFVNMVQKDFIDHYLHDKCIILPDPYHHISAPPPRIFA